jgi:hypothetical protein
MTDENARRCRAWRTARKAVRATFDGVHARLTDGAACRVRPRGSAPNWLRAWRRLSDRQRTTRTKVNFAAVAYMSTNRPFCGRTSRTTAEGVLAVQEIRPAMVHRPKSADPVSGMGLFLKGSCTALFI